MQVVAKLLVLSLLVLTVHSQANPPCGRETTPLPIPPATIPSSVKNATLLQVQVFIRHGDRTVAGPPVCWPNDTAVWNCSLTVTEIPNTDPSIHSLATPRLYRKNYLRNDETFTGNCMTGALTVKGYQQEIANGKDFAALYVNQLHFLSASLNPSELYLRVDDEQRTTQSLQAFMLGLYPTNGNSANTQIVDFWSIDDSLDYIAPNTYGCAALESAYNEAVSSSQYVQYVNVTEDPIIKYIADNAGMQPADVDLDHMFDCATVHFCQNLPTPSWLTTQLWQQLELIQNWEYPYVYTYPNFNTGIQQNIGYLFNDSFSRMPSQTRSYPKFVLWSGHDTTLVPILVALRVFDKQHWPGYASRIIWETWQLDGSQAVRMLYGQEEVLIPGCSSVLCPLNEFEAVLQPLIAKSACFYA